MKNLFYIAVILVLGGIISNTAQAQGFSTSPTTLNFEVEPGQHSTMQVTIKNDFNTKKEFRLSVGDWTQSNSGQIVYLPKGKSPQSAAKWLKVSPQLVELQPKESKKINVTLSTPAGKTSTHWAMLFVTTAQEQKPSVAADKGLRAGAFVTGEIAVPIMQSPKSKGTLSAKMSNLREQKGTASRMFLVDIANKGDKIIDGVIHTTLANIETGNEKELKVEKVMVLPNLTRTVAFALPSDINSGKYLLTRVLDYSSDANLEGSQLQIEVK